MTTKKRLWVKIQLLISINILIVLLIFVIAQHFLIPYSTEKYNECISKGGTPSGLIFVSCSEDKD